MAKFMVVVPFIGYATHEVEAENPQEAVTKALDLELTMDNIDSCTVGDHFEIDGHDMFASTLEVGRDGPLPRGYNPK